MRFYELLNFKHVVLYLFPTLIFMLIFYLALGYSHFRTGDSAERMNKIHHRFPEGIEDRNAPFPLALILIIMGTVIWGFFYILGYGLLGVKI